MESERILSSLGPQCPPPMANHAVVRSSHDHHAADFFSWITRGLGSPGSDRRRNPTRQNVLHPASDAASTKSFAAAAPDAAEEATSRQCRDDAPRLLTKSNLKCAEYEDARAQPVTQRADATATGAIQSQEHQERLRAELEQTKANNLKLKAQIWELRARINDNVNSQECITDDFTACAPLEPKLTSFHAGQHQEGGMVAAAEKDSAEGTDEEGHDVMPHCEASLSRPLPPEPRCEPGSEDPKEEDEARIFRLQFGVADETGVELTELQLQVGADEHLDEAGATDSDDESLSIDSDGDGVFSEVELLKEMIDNVSRATFPSKRRPPRVSLGPTELQREAIMGADRWNRRKFAISFIC